MPSMPPAGPLWQAYVRWRQVAGPLADFVSAAPFLAEGPVVPRRPSHPMAARLARRLRAATPAAPAATEEPPAPVAVFLDAPVRLGLAAGCQLVAGGWHVAPVIARWPVAGAVLSVEPVASWLAHAPGSAAAAAPVRGDGPSAGPLYGPAHRAVAHRAVAHRAHGGSTHGGPLCLLLDAGRAPQRSAAALRLRFDNRYDYLAHMLPPPDHFRRWGVARVLWAGGGVAVSDDLQGYVGSLAQAGLAVELAPLDRLCAR